MPEVTVIDVLGEGRQERSSNNASERKITMDQKWLESCLTAGEFLYGEFPVAVLQKLYETRGESVSVAEIMEFYDESYMMLCDGETFSPLIATEEPMLTMFKEADKNGNPYASLHFDLDELKELRRGHQIVASEDYWIPKAAQIEELVEQGDITSPAMEKLEAEINRLGGDSEFLKGIWGSVSTEKLDQFESINAVISGIFPEAHEYKDAEVIPEEVRDKIPTMDDLNSLMPYINEFLNSINNRNRKGWPPEELFKKQHPNGLTSMPTIMPGSAHFAKQLKEAEPMLRAMGANVDYSSIDSFATVGQYGERRLVKVGRNDPCPCGSGKKYKRCHGR